METKIDKFNKKFEEMFEGLHEKYDEIKSALDNNKASVNLFKRLKLRVEQLDQERANAKQDKVAREAYSKKLNLLVHGIEESIKEVWETKQSTLEKFDLFLKNGLKVSRSQIKVIDIHRLPQRHLFKQGHQVCRPIIVKLGSIFDKQLILSSCKNLKAYNANLFHDAKLTNGKQGRIINVTKYLPKTFVNQKKLLLPSFNKARKEKKKEAYWRIDHGQYCLFVDNEIIPPPITSKRLDSRESSKSVNEYVSSSQSDSGWVTRTRLLFNCYSHWYCIVTSVSVNVNFLWLE